MTRDLIAELAAAAKAFDLWAGASDLMMSELIALTGRWLSAPQRGHRPRFAVDLDLAG